MEHEKNLIKFQLHIDMYPLLAQEQKVCEQLFAHIAAVNAINESEFAVKFTLIEDIIPFIEKLLGKNNVASGGEIKLIPRVIDNHLHISRNQSPLGQVNDLAIISYLV